MPSCDSRYRGGRDGVGGRAGPHGLDRAGVAAVVGGALRHDGGQAEVVRDAPRHRRAVADRGPAKRARAHPRTAHRSWRCRRRSSAPGGRSRSPCRGKRPSPPRRPSRGCRGPAEPRRSPGRRRCASSAPRPHRSPGRARRRRRRWYSTARSGIVRAIGPQRKHFPASGFGPLTPSRQTGSVSADRPLFAPKRARSPRQGRASEGGFSMPVSRPSLFAAAALVSLSTAAHAAGPAIDHSEIKCLVVGKYRKIPRSSRRRTSRSRACTSVRRACRAGTTSR